MWGEKVDNEEGRTWKFIVYFPIVLCNTHDPSCSAEFRLLAGILECIHSFVELGRPPGLPVAPEREADDFLHRRVLSDVEVHGLTCRGCGVREIYLDGHRCSLASARYSCVVFRERVGRAVG
jgi:hypothetical protein